MLYPHLDAEQALMSITIEVEKVYYTPPPLPPPR